MEYCVCVIYMMCTSSDSDGEGDGGEEELQAELAELGGGGDEYAPVGEKENVGGAMGGGEEEDSDKSDVESSGRR